MHSYLNSEGSLEIERAKKCIFNDVQVYTRTDRAHATARYDVDGSMAPLYNTQITINLRLLRGFRVIVTQMMCTAGERQAN